MEIKFKLTVFNIRHYNTKIQLIRQNRDEYNKPHCIIQRAGIGKEYDMGYHREENRAGDNPFWQFSVSVYEAPEVARLCLFFQDDYDADVNLVLLCCWLGYSGVRVEEAAIEALVQLVAGWRQDIIQPLRDVRKRLKHSLGPFDPPMTTPIREEIARIELLCEQAQQDILYKSLEMLPGKNAKQAERTGVARFNLKTYATRLGLSTKETKRIVEPLLTAMQTALENKSRIYSD